LLAQRDAILPAQFDLAHGRDAVGEALGAFLGDRALDRRGRLGEFERAGAGGHGRSGAGQPRGAAWRIEVPDGVGRTIGRAENPLSAFDDLVT
jgi:hypothetical protein